MKVVVIGTGYVGLVTGTCLSEIGHFVTCVDKDPKPIEQLNAGKLPIYEPGLEELVMRNSEEGRLVFTTDLAEAVQDCLIIFLCVGTPQAEDGSADLSYVFSAAEEVAKAIPSYRIIVNKSTCPVGTSEKLREVIAKNTTTDFDVASNPEFLREGSAVDDFMRPDRVVVGCDDVRVTELLRELYGPVLRTNNPFLAMDRPSAEMAKYAANTMLASRISLMNELACVCEAMGADISEVRKVVGTDARIGPQYLYPSLGFGGSCLPKDVSACARLAQDAGLEDGVLSAVLSVNKRQTQRFIGRIRKHYADGLQGKTLAFWGVAFKARTDDLREAPALTVLDAMLESGARVRAFDPGAGERLAERYGGRVEVAAKCYDALQDADGLVIPTEWREFQSPDYDRMAAMMREKVIFDGRNLYSPAIVARHGFRYYSIGRPDA